MRQGKLSAIPQNYTVVQYVTGQGAKIIGMRKSPGTGMKAGGQKMVVIKICLLGVLAVLLALQFKILRPEYAAYIGVACGGLICVFIVEYLSKVFDQFGQLQQYVEANREYLNILLKMIGITYICEFSAGICKDAGFQTIAGQIEVFGKVCILLFGLPIVISLLQTIGNFV